MYLFSRKIGAECQRGCNIALKRGLLFLHLSGLPHLPGVPQLQVNLGPNSIFIIF